MMSVSVIIPIYKRVELLDACLESFKKSTVLPKEIIVVDDGNSPTDTEHIRECAKKYEVKLVILQQNMGAPSARNAGARIATGDALFFADADIQIEPKGLEYLLNALERDEKASFAYGDFMFGKILMRGKEFSVEELKKSNYISTMTLVRKAVFRPFDPRLTRFQDWDLWLSLALRGAHGVYVPELIFRATTGGSMSLWVPSILIKNARLFMWIPRVRNYMRARETILKKHLE